MEKENFNIVITGHIDHGKSTLIGRLLCETKSFPENKIKEIQDICEALNKPFEYAFIVDHLKEERERGITIDTTQIFFETNLRKYVIIDAPGHKEFIKNMITGASKADSAVIVVDANLGLEEQSKRHAFVLKLLGIRSFIIAINKIDTIDFSEKRFNEVKQDSLLFLQSLDLNADFIIPISAKNGDNITYKSTNTAWYEGPTLVESLDLLQKTDKKESKILLLPIQDVYQIKGEKIYVGKIESGKLSKEDNVFILPEKSGNKVKEVKIFGELRTEAYRDESIGVIFTSESTYARGDIISNKILNSYKIINANIFWLSQKTSDKNYKYNFNLLTQETNCLIETISFKLDSSSLDKTFNTDYLTHTEFGNVTLKLEKEIVIESKENNCEILEKFVLEKDGEICAIGLINNQN